MAGRTLIFVGVAWLVAVLIWLLLGKGTLAIAVLQGRPVSKTLISAFVFTYWFLLVGWIGLLAVGVLLVRKHR